MAEPTTPTTAAPAARTALGWLRDWFSGKAWMQWANSEPANNSGKAWVKFVFEKNSAERAAMAKIWSNSWLGKRVHSVKAKLSEWNKTGIKAQSSGLPTTDGVNPTEVTPTEVKPTTGTHMTDIAQEGEKATEGAAKAAEGVEKTVEGAQQTAEGVAEATAAPVEKTAGAVSKFTDKYFSQLKAEGLGKTLKTNLTTGGAGKIAIRAGGTGVGAAMVLDGVFRGKKSDGEDRSGVGRLLEVVVGGGVGTASALGTFAKAAHL